jgi:hypothetical protein
MTRLLESATKRGTEGTAFRALESYSAGGVVYSDNFNRADTTPPESAGTGLGAGWLATSWRIASNQATRTGGNDFAIFQQDIGTLDMWCEADVTPNGGYGVLNLRNEVSLANNYEAFWDVANNRYEIGISITGPGYTTIATGGAGANVAHKLRFEAQGTALRLYVDGVLTVSGTNGVLNSVDSPNNRYAGMNASVGPTFDNYRCGPLPYTP